LRKVSPSAIAGELRKEKRTRLAHQANKQYPIKKYLSGDDAIDDVALKIIHVPTIRG
jgi:hypothetical protein